jgi:small subunit ribosomal protein S4e
MPKALKLPVKEATWVTKCAPGPHPAERALPLRVLVRDYLGLARNSKEADYIISRGEILVDGRARKNPKFPVGLMDVVSIPKLNQYFRVLIDRHGRLDLVSIGAEEAEFKLCQVLNKRLVKGGKVQLNLHDGRNVVGDFGEVKRHDVVQLSLAGGTVMKHLKMAEGNTGLIVRGKNPGIVGRIAEIRKSGKHTIVVIEADGVRIETPSEYAFIVGEERPLITLPGVGTDESDA